MFRFCTSVVSLTLLSASIHAQSLIACEYDGKAGPQLTSIHPAPYLSESGLLCFDVRNWPNFSGQNCVTNGGRINWSGMVIVYVDGESEGRDMTNFRVQKPTINNSTISYTVEWTRTDKWEAMQRVEINRLTGRAVSWLIRIHGGETYQCRLEKRRI